MARRRAEWRRYGEMRQSKRRSLAVGAMKYVETGKAKYRAKYGEFMRISESAIKEANKRMRALEKAGLNYNHPYNHLAYYIDSQLEGVRRLPSPKALASGKYNQDDDMTWFIATEQALKFIRSPLSSVKGMENSNYYRVSRLQEQEVLPTEVEDSSSGELREATWRDFDDFLKFLGSEEVHSSIDQYGESDIIVDMLWDYWNTDANNRADNIKLMKMALSQYLDAGRNHISFDKAMRQRGIKIEDYIRRKQGRNSI